MTQDNPKYLRDQKEHLTTWLSRAENIQNAVPIIQSILEVTEWEIEALDNSTAEADEIPLAGLTAKLERDYDYMINALPLPPDYDPIILSNTTAVLAAGSANVYDHVTRVGDLGTPDASTYALKFGAQYRDLLERHSRPQTVRDLLAKLRNPQTLQRFDRAFQAYMVAKSGVGKRTTAAAEMRTLLDGIKGDMFEIARRSPNENMTWGILAKRLSKGSNDGPEYQELIDQGIERSRLISRLSDVLKDREGGAITDLDNVWTLLLDHIFIVLGLIDFDSVKP